MARYYTLEITETLFGNPCLTRRWGRIGASGQSLVHHFEKECDAVRLFLELTRQKKARGYMPRAIGLRSAPSELVVQAVRSRHDGGARFDEVLIGKENSAADRSGSK